MSAPLPESVVAILRDPIAALSALMIISGVHRELFAFAAQTAAPQPCASRRPKTNGNGAARHGKPKHRRGSRERDDQALLSAMQADPGGTIAAWAEAIGKSKSTAVTVLHRLRDANLVENSERVWSLVVGPPSEPVPHERWSAPLSGSARARLSTQ
jgi:hypothetical protein